jgi:PadR family transcriptional regulator, regulatory protein PadR
VHARVRTCKRRKETEELGTVETNSPLTQFSDSLPIDERVEYALTHIGLLGEAVHDKQKGSEMVQGTLDMLILRTLITGPAHGHTIARIIEHTSDNVLDVEQGSLYPALHRLEHRGWVISSWGVSENNRKAKFYKLTTAGKKQLTAETNRWRLLVAAIGRVLGEASD